MPELLSLPNELLIIIASNIPIAADLLSLLLCSRHLSNLCTPLLQHMLKALLATPDAFSFASKYGNVPLLKLLLARKHRLFYPPSHHQQMSLHVAARCNQSTVISFLLSRHANVNLWDMNGYTPLHTAVCAGQMGAVSTLLEGGANVNAITITTPWCSPLDLAVKLHHVDIVELLVRCDAKLNYAHEIERILEERAGNLELEVIWSILSRIQNEQEALDAVYELPWPPRGPVQWPPEGEMQDGDMIIPRWFELHTWE